MVGDQVPMELISPVAWTIRDFKVEILKLKGGYTYLQRYFSGVSDPEGVDIFPAGSGFEGAPLPDDILVPRDSSPYAFFSVMRKKDY
jgi:hypothetical protein